MIKVIHSLIAIIVDISDIINAIREYSGKIVLGVYMR